MALYGVDAWVAPGEAFGVYFNLFSRISPWTTRDGGRPAASAVGAGRVGSVPGTVPLLAVMIGSVSFDGVAEAPLWTGMAPDIAGFFESTRLSPERALEAAFLIGLMPRPSRLRLLPAGRRRGAQRRRRVSASGWRAPSRSHSCRSPFAYVAAHYVTLLLYQGQAMIYLASEPPGRGGHRPLRHRRPSRSTTASSGRPRPGTTRSVSSWRATWRPDVAHDKALALYDEARLAVRSQYWMLVVMVGFTSLALWLLAQSNG